MLTPEDHRRDSAGRQYVYPVVSRRAGGVSIGINLNVNNACNWACLYCQVENLQRGGPPPVDLGRLRDELTGFVDEVLRGDFMVRQVAPEARRLVDVAFSGNGEPTSSAQFADAVNTVGEVLGHFGLLLELKIRLITNGSLIHRQTVRDGLKRLGELGGEIWFKIDRVGEAASMIVNGVPQHPERLARRLEIALATAPTWLQTCWFALDNEPPDAVVRAAYCDFVRPFAERLAGIHLYGLARPSMQPQASRLGRLPVEELERFAAEIEKKTGARVVINP